MLEKVLKYAFGLTGALTGMTLVRFLFNQNEMRESLSTVYGIGAVVLVSVLLGVFMFVIGGKVINMIAGSVEKIEQALQKITLYELMLGVCGLIAGLSAANLISIPIVKIDIIGIPISILINILLGICGVFCVAQTKRQYF